MPQSYRGYPTKLGEEHWLQQTRSQNSTGENGSILRYFFRFLLQGMYRSCCHDSVFLIRPILAHNNILQVILKISLADLANVNVKTWKNVCFLQVECDMESSHLTEAF